MEEELRRQEARPLKANPKLDYALWMAAEIGDAESVLALMYAGANPYYTNDDIDDDELNAIETALEYGHTEVVKVIADAITQGIYDYDSDGR